MFRNFSAMAFFKDLGVSVKTTFTSVGFLLKHGLWYYFLFPVIFAFLIWWFFDAIEVWASEALTGLLLDWLGLAPAEVAEDAGWWDSITGWFQDTAASAVDKLVAITFGFMFSWLLLRTGKYVLLILLSPVMAFLSEAVEKKLTGNEYKFNAGEFAHDILRGIAIAIRNMILEYLVIIALFIIMFFFPVLTVILVPMGYVFGWYFYGFAMMDYTNERRRLSISESVRYVRRHKGMAIGNGMAFSVIFSIPLLGPIFAPIMAVSAATMSIHEVTGLSKPKGEDVAQDAAPPPPPVQQPPEIKE